MKTNLIKWARRLPVLAILFPAVISAQGIINTSGTNLVFSGSAYLVINNGGFKNDGTFTAGSGTVSFTGTTATANSFIDGASATAFNNLTINKGDNGIQLNRHISVSGIIDLQSGDSLFLNNYNIDLSSTGSITGETNSKRITSPTGGYLQITQTLNAPSAVNPGNIGLEITSLADLGSTVIKRGNQQQCGVSIYRYFDITPTNNSSLDASISFYYFDSELAAVAEGNLAVFSSADGGTIWYNHGADVLNPLLNYVVKNGMNQLNRITLYDVSLPLAVHLLNFHARPVNRQAWLNWSTANEFNSDHFEIERSVDGINFINIASVMAAGNSNDTRYYEYKDINPFAGTNYYRLKQVDIDSRFIYSKQVIVKISQPGDAYLTLYPNPAGEKINIVITSAKDEDYQIELFDAKGTFVGSKKVHGSSGINEFEWNIQYLPAGIYIIKIIGSGLKSMQFIKGNN